MKNMRNTYNLYTDKSPEEASEILKRMRYHTLNKGGYPKEYFYGFTRLIVNGTTKIDLVEYRINFEESEDFVKGAKTLIFTDEKLARKPDGQRFRKSLRPALDAIFKKSIEQVRDRFRNNGINVHLVKIDSKDGEESLPRYETLK